MSMLLFEDDGLADRVLSKYGPGPGEYNPAFKSSFADSTHRTVPAFSWGTADHRLLGKPKSRASPRRKPKPPDETPGPGSYSPRASAAFSPLSTNFNSPSVNISLPTARPRTSATHSLPADADAPGPGAYSPRRGGLSVSTSPSYSITRREWPAPVGDSPLKYRHPGPGAFSPETHKFDTPRASRRVVPEYSMVGRPTTGTLGARSDAALEPGPGAYNINESIPSLSARRKMPLYSIPRAGATKLTRVPTYWTPGPGAHFVTADGEEATSPKATLARLNSRSNFNRSASNWGKEDGRHARDRQWILSY